MMRDYVARAFGRPVHVVIHYGEYLEVGDRATAACGREDVRILDEAIIGDRPTCTACHREVERLLVADLKIVNHRLDRISRIVDMPL